ncbi:type II toxin-antitoxin system VapC family toxin [Candidatus Poribacteria bacterium]|nr:type II toxin-antitoxin system VapC family toxin [Candidatus Poribacteria bacterium]
MANYYFDSSGLVKRYVAEVGSAWVKAICAPIRGNQINIVSVTKVEIASAFSRRCREGALTASDRDTLIRTFLAHCATQYRVIRTDKRLIEAAVDLTRRYPLRAYDAVQLAAAIRLNRILLSKGLSPIIFVSADDRLLAAALAEGLTVENPNHHP